MTVNELQCELLQVTNREQQVYIKVFNGDSVEYLPVEIVRVDENGRLILIGI